MRTQVKLYLTALLLALLTQFSTTEAEAAVLPGVGIPTTGLQLYYDAANINSYSGAGTSITDLSGNGNTGTLIGSPSYTHTSAGGFFTFADGGQNASTDGYEHILVSNFNPSFASGITISFYGSFGSAADAYERIIDFGSGAQNQNIIFGRDYYSNNIYYESYNGSGSRGRCTSSGGITTGVQLWTVVVSSTGCNIYNGSSISSVGSSSNNLLPTDLGSARSKMYVGRSNWGDSYLGGSIYRLAIYNRAINVNTELASLATSMTDTDWPSLSGAYTFTVNENISTVASLSATEISTYLEYTDAGNHSVLSVTGSGVVTFDTSPNFESPNPSNTLSYYFYVTDPNGNSRLQTITIYVSDVQEYASLSTPSLNATPYKGIPVTISVSPAAGGTAGKVTFLWNGKRIPKCYNKAYPGTGTSTCIWKPASIGYEKLSVTFTPNKTAGNVQEYASATSTLTPYVLKRMTNR